MGLQVGISISEIAPHLEDLSVDAAVTKTIQNVNDQDAVSVSAIPEHCPLCREKKLKDTFLICEKSKGLTQKVDEIIEMICSGAQLLEYICDFFIVNTNSSLNCRGYKHTKRKLFKDIPTPAFETMLLLLFDKKVILFSGRGIFSSLILRYLRH